MAEAIREFLRPLSVKIIFGLIGFIATLTIAFGSYAMSVKADCSEVEAVKTEVKRVEEVAGVKFQAFKDNQDEIKKRLESIDQKVTALPDIIYKRLKGK